LRRKVGMGFPVASSDHTAPPVVRKSFGKVSTSAVPLDIPTNNGNSAKNHCL